jgi:hypothetical protein
MKVFPQGPISVGTVASLSLSGVRSTSDGKEARYRVHAVDPVAFTSTFAGAGPRMGLRYEPVRGAVWGSLEIPEDRDEVHLVVGVPRRYGVALSKARQELQPRAGSVLPDSSIRALIRGILDREGRR